MINKLIKRPQITISKMINSLRSKKKKKRMNKTTK